MSTRISSFGVIAQRAKPLGQRSGVFHIAGHIFQLLHAPFLEFGPEIAGRIGELGKNEEFFARVPHGNQIMERIELPIVVGVPLLAQLEYFEELIAVGLKCFS
jgi:hypothetical protein